MSLLSNTTVLLGKELRTEFRSRELLTTTIVFILIVIVLFSFTFDPTADESRRFGPGLLWLAFLFAASLMLQPCFLREQNNDTLERAAAFGERSVRDFSGQAGRQHAVSAADGTAAAADFRGHVQRAGAAGASLAGVGVFSGQSWEFPSRARRSPPFPRRRACANCFCRCCCCRC